MNISTYKFFIFLIGEVMYYLAFHLFFTGILKVKTKTSFLNLSSTGWITLGIILYFIQIPSYLSIASSVLICVMLSIRYSDNLKRNILYALLFSLHANMVELVATYTISFLTGISIPSIVSDNGTYTVTLLTCRFVLLLISFIIFITKDKFDISRQTTHFWPVIVLFTFGSLYTLSIIYYLILGKLVHHYSIIIAVLTILMIFNLTVYYLYNRQCKDFILREENNRLVNYIQIQKTQLEETNSYNKKIATLKHDMNHLFVSLNELMNHGNYAEASEIINRNMQKFTAPSHFINTPDDKLNALLNYKISYANNHNIHISCNSLITNRINIKFDDLCVLLGNGLDNAMEYLLLHNLNDKEIHIKLSYDYGIFRILISNPTVDNIPIPTDYLLPSSKPEGQHGYGIYSMKMVVERYHGIFSITCDDYLFSLQMSLIC